MRLLTFILTIIATSAAAFDDIGHMANTGERGRMAKYEAAGYLIAAAEDDRKYCNGRLSPERWTDVVDRLAKSSDAAKKAVAVGAYYRAKSDTTYVFSVEGCLSIEATAHNFGLLKTRPLDDEEREFVFMASALDSNNCSLARQQLWRFLAARRYSYLQDARDVEQWSKATDEGRTAGLEAAPAFCAKIEAFGTMLEQPQDHGELFK
jgi:hypothetical protein